MLRLANVTKSYRDGPGMITALDTVDLEVRDGSFVVVMGPSGSGKTTLALIAAGVEKPSSGEVWLDDLDVARAGRRKRAALRRRSIGIVFQSGELDPLLSAGENVALPLRLDDWSAGRATASANEALHRCGVDSLAHRYPAELSGGQRQRIAVARAIVGDRRLIVADEPTASIDSITARAVVELLADLAAGGLGVLMTTHDSRMAGFADEIVLLRDGAQVRGDAQRAPDGFNRPSNGGL